jgi:1-pyrroline-5-carboxylate dehydrogenase
MAETFKLTYSTMFNPPEELHTRFDEALTKVKGTLGKEYGMIIGGKDRFTADKFEDRSPANTDIVLGVFQKGSEREAEDALAAARKAFPLWSKMKWQERVRLLRKAADLIDQRTFEIGAAMAMEVGKNRMESLGDVAETADLVRYSCFQMEKNEGYLVEMGRDPLVGYTSTNVSVLRPDGVWLVISPFNFPTALTGGPAGAALVTGNTIIIKRLIVDVCNQIKKPPQAAAPIISARPSLRFRILVKLPSVISRCNPSTWRNTLKKKVPLIFLFIVSIEVIFTSPPHSVG